MTVARYRDDILQQLVILLIRNHGNNVRLQQENARPHVARVVQKFLQQQNVNLIDWPAVSPDFSPIKRLLDEMDRRLRRLPNPPVT